jgi:predicted CopG family antitoxin
MGARTVALDEEAYDLLKRAKQKDETFSEAVKRLVRPRRPLSEFAGRWSGMKPTDRAALSEIYRASRKADERRSERIRRSWG